MAHISHLYRKNNVAMTHNYVISEMVFGLLAIIVDILLVFVLTVATGFLYHYFAYGNVTHQHENYLKLALLVSLIYVVLNFIHKRYKISSFLSQVSNLKVVFKIWNHTFLFVLAGVFLQKTSEDFSRGSVVLFYVVGFLGLWAARKLFKFLAVRGCRKGYISVRRIMLVGDKASLAAYQNKNQPWRYGLKVIDTLLLDDNFSDNNLSLTDSERAQSDLDMAVVRARNLQIDEIYLLIPWTQSVLIKKYAEAFRKAPVSIHLAEDNVLKNFDDVELLKHGEISSMNLVRPPLNMFEVGVKRLFDIVASLIGLTILLIALPFIAFLIKREDRGAIFFKQPRGGFNSQPFCIYKFRTFKSEQSGQVAKTKDGKDTIEQAKVGDTRITKLGQFLRKSNIDELPQLINVLKGEMSIVGPRPHAVQHDQEFSEKVATYARRHNVKPGITGWAQVTGFRGITDTDEKIKGRVASDLYYIDHWSIWFDIYIVFLTILSKKARSNAV